MTDYDSLFLTFVVISSAVYILVMYLAKKRGTDITNRAFQMKLVVYCSPLWLWPLFLKTKSWTFVLTSICIITIVVLTDYRIWKMTDKLAAKSKKNT